MVLFISLGGDYGYRKNDPFMMTVGHGVLSRVTSCPSLPRSEEFCGTWDFPC